MDKLKISEWGEKLKTGGAQMSRIVSDKVKDILQAPTLESKMDCAQINNNEFNATEIVRAIKRKISGKSPVSQRLSLELLEACAMNCEKIFSEVVSERVHDEMALLVKNGEGDSENRRQAFHLVRAWGQSQELGLSSDEDEK
ncbi:hypothetical protein BRARA_I02024 [Brassica rapa]|uniref:VHS domain-containing protein n=1 Tax=Brassica campestris TaxID=3711 RepID=A0A397XV89_BRACM|nr:hypothetical protein BRARA_I02024 [Brassica rapa]